MRKILEVTEPAEITRLTTLAAFKSELGVNGTENDTAFGALIDYCSDEISAWLMFDTDQTGNVTIGRETVTETFYDVADFTDLVLGRLPIGDIVSVTEDGVTTPRQIEDEDNPAFGYVVKKSAGMLWKASSTGIAAFTASIVAVEYTAGWILPDAEEGRTLPKGIEDACLRFCHIKMDQVQDGEDISGPLTSTTLQGVGTFQFAPPTGTRGSGVPYEVRNLIQRYKLTITA